MKIRPSTIEDAAELARLHRGTIRSVNGKDYPAEVIEGWATSTAKRFRDGHDKVIQFVAVEAGKIVGFGELTKEDGNIGAMYVHKDWIGKGVGKKLFAVLEAEAVKRGEKRFSFLSSTTAKAFYESCGCVTVKKTTHKLSSGVLMDAYQMEKELGA